VKPTVNSGILLIDKPEGITSFGVVRRLKRVLGVKKIGHLGTLDPFATGLLPLGVNEGTKLTPFLMGEAKTYRATLKLGEETDTQDLTGKITARSDKLPEADTVRRMAARFVGEINQAPPMFSAVHHQGERLYNLARRGEKVEPAPRPVVIHKLQVEAVALPRVTFTVSCSKGTYIRTLAADLGKALGCGAHLVALRRLEVGPFSVEGAVTLEELQEMAPEDIWARIIPPARCLAGMKAVMVEPEEARQVAQGRALIRSGAELEAGEPVRVMNAGELVAVARVGLNEDMALIKPVRVFAAET
jgi:tRNA pseudouridine55 synthase